MSYAQLEFSSPFDQAVILGKIPCGIEDSPSMTLPLFLERISAGFPSPADDYIEAQLDLNRILIKNEAATFLVRVGGDSMINAGIHDKDILVVDKSEDAVHGKIVVAVVDGVNGHPNDATDGHLNDATKHERFSLGRPRLVTCL